MKILTRSENELATDFASRVIAEAGGIGRIIVEQGYESPYIFARNMRAAIGDDNASVHLSHHNPPGPSTYIAFGDGSWTAVIHTPGE